MKPLVMKHGSSLFDYNDVGLPIAYGIAEKLVTPGDDGEIERMIDETWVMLCNYIDVDYDGEYETIDDLFAASPKRALEQDDERVSQIGQ